MSYLPEKCAGILLAAGASRRMGSPKALLDWDGQTILDRLIAAFTPVCADVVVVLGYHADKIRAGIQRAADVRFAVNPDPERGQLSSLQCGLRAVEQPVEAFLFTPLDYPAIEPATITRLAKQFFAAPARPLLAVPCYEERHGHPVLVSATVAAELLALPESGQARDVVHRHRDRTLYVDTADPGILLDVDAPEDYRRLREAVRK